MQNPRYLPTYTTVEGYEVVNRQLISILTVKRNSIG